MPPSDSVAFARMRQLIDACQDVAQRLACYGAVGPLICFDRRPITDPSRSGASAPRWEFRTIASVNHRGLLKEIFTQVVSATVANDVSAVALMRTCLHTPSPVSVRATVLACCTATTQVFASEGIIRPDLATDWQALCIEGDDPNRQCLRLLQRALVFAADTRRVAIPLTAN